MSREKPSPGRGTKHRPAQRCHKLALKNLGLIGQAIKRVRGLSYNDFDDAFQVGYIALVNAARLHDPTRGAFSTVGFITVFRAVARWFHEQTLIRIPAHIFTDPKYAPARQHAQHIRCPSLLNQERLDAIPNYRTDEADMCESAQQNEQVALVADAMRYLSPRDRLVLERRMNGEILQAIADDYGVSRERIRQIQLRSVAKIKQLVGAA